LYNAKYINFIGEFLYAFGDVVGPANITVLSGNTDLIGSPDKPAE
jgi:hypothetical protein